MARPKVTADDLGLARAWIGYYDHDDDEQHAESKARLLAWLDAEQARAERVEFRQELVAALVTNSGLTAKDPRLQRQVDAAMRRRDARGWAD